MVGVVGMGLLVGFSEEAQEDGFGHKYQFLPKRGRLEKGGFFCEKIVT